MLRRCDERKQAQRRSKDRVHIFTRRATPADGLEKTTGAAPAPPLGVLLRPSGHYFWDPKNIEVIKQRTNPWLG